MGQEKLLPGLHEPVNEREVRALIERFGERQPMAQGQTTVQDVAEALQVDPATVGKMLNEVRESESQREIKQRLDRLERENAELRDRAANSSVFHSPFADARVRGPFLTAMFISIVVVGVATRSASNHGGGLWFKQFVAILAVAACLFMVGWRLYRKDRS